MQRFLSISMLIRLSIVFSIHYYLWARLVRDVGLPPGLQTALTALVVLLGVSLLVWLSARSAGWVVTRGLLLVSYSWMGTFFILLCLVGTADLLEWLLGALWSLDAAQRMLASRVGAAAVAIAGSGIVAAAFRLAWKGPESVHVPVRLARWPQALDDFRIAQISDLHVAPLLGRRYVEEVVARCNAEQPDLVVITGDLVDGTPQDLGPVVTLLGSLRAPHGVFFVTGNHEYYSGVDAWLAFIKTLGIRTLRNERVSIGDARGSFDLAGIDDATAHHHGQGHGADLSRAMAGRDPQREVILLAHQPKAVFDAEKHGVGLLLSGHTHNGQLWPLGYLVRLAQPYVQGLARHGQTQVYVNRGTGYWGPPMRLGAAPELTVLHVSRGAAEAPQGAK